MRSDGSVQQTQILRSVPELDLAAVFAVGQWTYEPTRINGTAVPVIFVVSLLIP